jgi:arylsulfatase A-like enzyme
MAMTRRTFLSAAGLGLAAAGCSPLLGARTAGAGRPSRPNIVFIMADDLGYGDVGCLNPRSSIPTPCIDRLAAGGMTFTDAHSPSAVCTPTRYGVVTGRYSWRSRLKSGVLWGYSEPLIEADRPTVASLLKGAGYATGVVGKWHLGLDWTFGPGGQAKGDVDWSVPLRHGPNALGFEYAYVIPASLDMPPYVYVENGRVTETPTARQQAVPFPAFIRAGPRAPGFRPVETLDHLLGKAKGFIESHAAGPKPFFLYFALTTPHKPVLPAERFRGKSGLGPYGDFIMQVDWTVGQVVETLKAAGVRDNTLVILTSDNGSFMYRYEAGRKDHVDDPGVQAYREEHHTANYIFRGTKADIYEGGHHVPWIVSWPGTVAAGTACRETICHVDLMATCAAVAGVGLPAGAAEDSFSTLPLMRGRGWETPRAPVVHHSANGTFALRDGKWKAVFSTGSGGREKPAGKPFSTPYRLFDMEADPRETTDVAADHPEVLQRLTARLEAIRSSRRSRVG